MTDKAMDSIKLGNSDLLSSRLAYGCMRVDGDKGKAAIRAAVDAGYTHFDHADIYAGGNSEAIFGKVLRESPGLREQILITSKCGIRLAPKRYDFSRKHILDSVDGSLQRLDTGYLDLLLLHRPDYLMDPDEVADAFATLKQQGKVRHFGASNFRPSQFALLRQACAEPLLVNQIEINIDNIGAFQDGTLDHCMQNRVTPLAWCPLGGVAYPAWHETMSREQHGRVEAELASQAKKYGAVPWVVLLAWLLRHPSKIVPIIGSTQPARIREATQSLQILYSREDWYRLLEARIGQPVA